MNALIICLKKNKYIIDKTKPVKKLNSKEFLTVSIKDFLDFDPTVYPITPSEEKA